MKNLFSYLFALSLGLLPLAGVCKLNSSLTQNKWLYGKELKITQFSDSMKNFNGKITYKVPNTDWNVLVTYTNGKSFAEAARPSSTSRRRFLSQSNANAVADTLFPKKDRGIYRKQVKNARFISHFFQNGVVSFEMKLDPKNKSHIGIEGVRVHKYQNGTSFSKAVKVNAYH